MQSYRFGKLGLRRPDRGPLSLSADLPAASGGGGRGLGCVLRASQTTGPNGATGRQAYFAIAQVADVIEDRRRPDHYYALMRGYIAFDNAVPFRDVPGYRESKLLRDDGKTNKGAFGRAVRELPRHEFEEIVRRGVSLQPEPWEPATAVAEAVPEYVTRPIVEVVTARKVRDIAFRRQVRAAYSNTCAVTGLA